jgi:hypothetical protein
MQLSTMYGLASQRLNEGANQGGPTSYPTAEIIRALNEAQRFFCLLTIGLEKTVSWPAAAATTFFHMLTTNAGLFADWIVPLRITTTGGAKVRPSRLDGLTSLDSQWVTSAGNPYRYVHVGADLLGLYQQPAGGATLNVTYARAPAALAADSDVPEIPAEYHPSLVDYGIYRCRQSEGGDEFAKAMPLLNGFLDAAQKYADYVRARNKGFLYDSQPFELQSFDRSRLLGKTLGKKAR